MHSELQAALDQSGRDGDSARLFRLLIQNIPRLGHVRLLRRWTLLACWRHTPGTSGDALLARLVEADLHDGDWLQALALVRMGAAHGQAVEGLDARLADSLGAGWHPMPGPAPAPPVASVDLEATRPALSTAGLVHVALEMAARMPAPGPARALWGDPFWSALPQASVAALVPRLRWQTLVHGQPLPTGACWLLKGAVRDELGRVFTLHDPLWWDPAGQDTPPTAEGEAWFLAPSEPWKEVARTVEGVGEALEAQRSALALERAWGGTELRSRLPADQADALLRQASGFRVPGGIIRPWGSASDGIGVVVEGTLEMIWRHEGASRRLDALGPGDVFGGEPGELAGLAHCELRAEGPLSWVWIPGDISEPLLQAHPACEDWLRALAHRRWLRSEAPEPSEELLALDESLL
jgi:hypothetical protein